MLWFLSIAAQRGFPVETYRDEAVGVMGRDVSGKPAITKVTLHPQEVFAADTQLSPSEFEAMQHEAHEQCFIARSVKTDVVCQARDVTP
jgi:organic hydroperoxide reductase OsmC/OhrA